MKALNDIFRKGRRALEKALAPGGNVSYSQFGEDLFLDALLDHRPTGYYVDVGCNEPIKLSNTYRFYRKGWAGVCIDANERFREDFLRSRPRDIFMRACVSDVKEQVQFHHFQETALSSISGTPLYDNSEHYRIDHVETVTTDTLTDLLVKADAPSNFDLLSVDVEGHDERVLRSLNFSRFQPEVILAEANMTELIVGCAQESKIVRFLESNGYTLRGVQAANLFFVRALN